MRLLLLSALLATAGCTVGRAVGAGFSVPKERAAECKQHCEALDMRLTAVVLVMNSAGCVCEPRGQSASLSGGAAAAAGGATIAAIQQQQQQQAQRPGQGPGSPPFTPQAPPYTPPHR